MGTASLRSVLLATVLLGASVRVAGAQAGAQAVCDVAATAAEVRHEVPAGLLRAIGRIESGRRDPATGQVAAWPWSINAAGRGSVFETQAEALAATRALQAGGTASVDVGCFQVNLVHHPAAFATLEEGFDPARNADYAARFLQSLRARTGSWEAAVAAYHSATPERGNPYRDRVLATWSSGAAGNAGLPGGVAPAPPPQVPAVRVVTWSPGPSSGGMRVWTPSAAGQGASMIVIAGPSLTVAARAPRPPRG